MFTGQSGCGRISRQVARAKSLRKRKAAKMRLRAWVARIIGQGPKHRHHARRGRSSSMAPSIEVSYPGFRRNTYAPGRSSLSGRRRKVGTDWPVSEGPIRECPRLVPGMPRYAAGRRLVSCPMRRRGLALIEGEWSQRTGGAEPARDVSCGWPMAAASGRRVQHRRDLHITKD